MCVTGSMWYFPQTSTLLEHEKYFLMDSRYERAGTIGFRCAADVADQDQDQTCAPGQALCASFQAPDAFTDVDGTNDWVVAGSVMQSRAAHVLVLVKRR